jgi:hypothetical protein
MYIYIITDNYIYMDNYVYIIYVYTYLWEPMSEHGGILPDWHWFSCLNGEYDGLVGTARSWAAANGCHPKRRLRWDKKQYVLSQGNP